MPGSEGVMEDYVVDVVVEVGSGGADLAELTRRVTLPGVTLQRATARGTLWLTAIVAAPTEAAARHRVRDAILTQVADLPGAAASTMVTGVALGELYARLDGSLADDELADIDVADLVRERMWERDWRAEPGRPGLRSTG